MDYKEIEIPAFSHPHLFWIFETADTTRRKNLRDALGSVFEKTAFHCNEKWNCGDIIAVKREEGWARGTIQRVLPENGNSRFQVWLQDYAQLLETKEVFKLSENYKNIPQFTKQASLYQVVYNDETLDLEMDTVKIKQQIKPSISSIEISLKVMKNAVLYFSTVKMINDIHYGDILVKSKNLKFSLTKFLIKEKILAENIDLFDKIIEQAITDKDIYYCNVQSAGKRVEKNKYEADRLALECNLLTRTSRKSVSETEHSDIESKSNVGSKTRALMELVKKKKQCATQCNSEEVLTKCEETEEPDLNKDESKEDKTSLKKFEDVFSKSQPKLLTTEKMLFTPAGSSISLQTKSQSQKMPKKLNYMSDSAIYQHQNRAKRLQRGRRSAEEAPRCESLAENSDDSDRCRRDRTRSKIKEAVSQEPKKESSDAVSAPDAQLKMKPTCSCSNCEFWTNAEGWGSGCEKFADDKIAFRSEILRPQSILLPAPREKKLKIVEVSYKGMTKSDKQASFKVLTHGILSVQPIEKIVDAPFNAAIHNSLKKLGYSRTRKIQAYMWPAVSRSMNVCFVNRAHTGKTLAYLAPLCSFLMDREERYRQLRRMGGPFVIVLADTSKRCEKIYDLTNRIFEGTFGRPRAVLATYPFDYVNMSSVDLLVTMPSVLVELLKKNATNLRRLCHLVFDGTDAMLKTHGEEIEKILMVAEGMLKNRSCLINVQVIAAAERWTANVEKFCKRLRNTPLICIGDYLEAAIYGRSDLVVKITMRDQKAQATAKILSNKWKFHRCLVICETDAEIDEIKEAFVLDSISFVEIRSHLSKEQIFQQEINWERTKSGENMVLICTDNIMQTMLSVTDATLLVNYSFPESWSMLIKRFHYLLESYKSPLSNDELKMTPEIHVLVDENCEEQLPRLISSLKKFPNILNTEFYQLYQQDLQNKEHAKIGAKVNLCDNIKQFGYCANEQCPDRHKLSKDLDDVNTSLPKSGPIKFRIDKIEDVCKLSVTLSNNAEKTELYELNDRKPVDEFVKGKRCLYWDCDEFDPVYRSCRILETTDDFVKIRFKNENKLVSRADLFEFPDDFHLDDEIHAELIVANFKPPYHDETYSRRAYGKLAYHFEDKIGTSSFSADVRLRIGDTVWASNVLEEVHINGLTLYKEDYAKTLKDFKVVESNGDHLRNLYRLCADAEISLPVYTNTGGKKMPLEEKQLDPRYAFMDPGEVYTVYFSSAISPDEMYVRLEKFNSLLERLEKELEHTARKQSTKKDLRLTVGKMYIVHNPSENTYGRAILKQTDDTEALLFCVDYGDEVKTSVENLYYLPDSLIAKLPCQAILCRLYGLKPINEDWDDVATDILYDLSVDQDDFRTFYGKCMYYDKDIASDRNIHSILLKYVTDKSILINQLIIESGFGTSRTAKDIEDFELPVDEVRSADEEAEELMDIIKITETIDSNVSKTKSSNQGAVIPYSEKTPELDDNELDFAIFDIDCFLSQILKAKPEQETKIKASPTETHLPTMTAEPAVDYYTPDLYWSQTKENIKMKIMLTNVTDYSVKIERGRWFSFRCDINDKKYRVKLILYEAVKKEYQHEICGMEIRVVFWKSAPAMWDRLTLQAKRLRNIHYVLSKEELEEEPHKRFLDLGDISPGHCSSDSDNGIFWDVSDMDSEFDKDIEEDSS